MGIDMTFSYQDRPVVSGLTLCVQPGRTTLLLGANGSGKTTALWLLAGLLRPGGGSVVLCDDPAVVATHRPARFPLAGLGMVFQQPALWEHLTVAGHLELVLRGRGLAVGERRSRVSAMLERMGLGDLASRRASRLSGGQRQRLAIARALVIHPSWLLLDEPLSHLDAQGQQVLAALLARPTGERPGVLVTAHDDRLARFADNVITLHDGRVATGRGDC